MRKVETACLIANECLLECIMYVNLLYENCKFTRNAYVNVVVTYRKCRSNACGRSSPSLHVHIEQCNFIKLHATYIYISGSVQWSFFRLLMNSVYSYGRKRRRKNIYTKFHEQKYARSPPFIVCPSNNPIWYIASSLFTSEIVKSHTAYVHTSYIVHRRHTRTKTTAHFWDGKCLNK